MIIEKLKKVLSFNGIFLIIGILGGLSSILTVFITKWNAQISLKWLVLTIFIGLIIILILIKLIFNLNEELRYKTQNKARIMKYLPDKYTFLIEKNQTFGYSAMVSIFYYLDDIYETEVGKGYVKNIQDQFIQIQLLNFSEDFKKNHQGIIKKINDNDINTLKKIIVKNYIKYSK